MLYTFRPYNIIMQFPRNSLICHQFFKHKRKISSIHTFISSIFTSQSLQFSQKMQFSAASVSDPSSIIPPNNTNLLLFINHSPVKNALWEARSSIFWRSPSSSIVTSSTLPINDDYLIAKTPSRSRTSVLYKFSLDYGLRERYRNPKNEIRVDKLLEDLDALAGIIAYKHCSTNDGTAKSLTIVTASMENLILKKPINIETDLTIEGAVTWVGCSSLEIQLNVKQSTQEATNTLDSVSLTANFTFVARDSKTGKSAKINPISPENEKEKHLWKEAEEKNKMRKKKKKEKKDNNLEKRVNKMLLSNRDKNKNNNILIKETCLQNSLVCQPEQKNIHGQIFGGYLMRKAYELAYATTYSFVGSPPCFVEVDHVDFLKPVDVGDLLHLKSCVLYTQVENSSSRPLINVEVVAHVTQPQHFSTEEIMYLNRGNNLLQKCRVSNNFYFTFTVCSDKLRKGSKIRNVIPDTEEEARRVIEYIDVVRNKRHNIR